MEPMNDETYELLLADWQRFDDWNNKSEQETGEVTDDPVNHPAHYTQGKYEAIDVLEDALSQAPDPVFAFLQGQTLKYLLRLWNKENAQQDAAKARWYLDRLIDKLD